MRRSVKLNGTIKVGLGQSPSGKVLDGNTRYLHFYTSHDSKQEQIDKLKTALQWHKETGKRMFYSYRSYREIKEDWIINRIKMLQEVQYKEI